MQTRQPSPQQQPSQWDDPNYPQDHSWATPPPTGGVMSAGFGDSASTPNRPIRPALSPSTQFPQTPAHTPHFPGHYPLLAQSTAPLPPQGRTRLLPQTPTPRMWGDNQLGDISRTVATPSLFSSTNTNPANQATTSTPARLISRTPCFSVPVPIRSTTPWLSPIQPYSSIASRMTGPLVLEPTTQEVGPEEGPTVPTHTSMEKGKTSKRNSPIKKDSPKFDDIDFDNNTFNLATMHTALEDIPIISPRIKGASSVDTLRHRYGNPMDLYFDRKDERE